MAWVHERFALPNGILFFVLYAAALLVGRALTTSGPLVIGAVDGAGFLATWAFFLMLRVFDEHKDYALDLQNHPGRVLQSGRITLSHLKVVGVVAVAVQLGLSVWRDHGFGRVTIAWLVAFAWSLLMAKEFFIGEWLGKRLVLYAVSHMLVMPLAILWIAQQGSPDAPLPSAIGAMAFLSFFSGFAFELARKTKAPEEERPTVDSYTKALGVRAAPVTVVVVLAIGIVASLLVLSTTEGSIPIVAASALAATVLPPAAAVSGFLRSPTPKGAKRIEAMVGVAMLIGYVIVIASVVGNRGVGWR